MLISNENFVRSNFAATPAVQNSAKHSTAFSLLIERNEVRIENDQSSALSFNALGMFGNFDSINFIESSPPAYAAQNNADLIADNTQILYKSSEIIQHPNTAITKQKSQSAKYNFPKLTMEYVKNLKNINNFIIKNFVYSSINQQSESNFRNIYLSSFVSVNGQKMHERLINSFHLNISQKDGQFFVSLTGSVFDLTNSLKMRDISSSILKKFGIKNGILYINAINVTKAYYFIREENHGSGTR